MAGKKDIWSSVECRSATRPDVSEGLPNGWHGKAPVHSGPRLRHARDGRELEEKIVLHGSPGGSGDFAFTASREE
jgi:hypothetical protein